MFSSEEGLVLKSFSSSVESAIEGGIGTETSGVRTVDPSQGRAPCTRGAPVWTPGGGGGGFSGPPARETLELVCHMS